MKLQPTMEVGDVVKYHFDTIGIIVSIKSDSTFRTRISGIESIDCNIADFTWDDSLQRWVEK